MREPTAITADETDPARSGRSGALILLALILGLSVLGAGILIGQWLGWDAGTCPVRPLAFGPTVRGW